MTHDLLTAIGASIIAGLAGLAVLRVAGAAAMSEGAERQEEAAAA